MKQPKCPSRLGLIVVLNGNATLRNCCFTLNACWQRRIDTCYQLPLYSCKWWGCHPYRRWQACKQWEANHNPLWGLENPLIHKGDY
jgi:hypothetical protein